eukprot:3323457-Alexandrium_andersonii.AAC.1
MTGWAIFAVFFLPAFEIRADVRRLGNCALLDAGDIVPKSILCWQSVCKEAAVSAARVAKAG